MNNDSNLTRIHDYIKASLPWAHGHQLNSLTTFVSAIFDKQTGCQADLARTQGNQEAACKRLSRLIHNERLSPKWLAESIAHQALGQVPQFGKVRFTIDWTTEDEQHLLIVSLVIGRRAVPIFWRAYHQSVLKGRMHLYERAVIKRAFKWNQIPKVYGDDSTIHRTFQRWVQIGIFEMIWSLLLTERDGLGLVDWQWQAADGTLGKARGGGDKIGWALLSRRSRS
jgi:hypothetical protein